MRSFDAGPLLRGALTTALATAGVLTVAFFQHRFVLGVGPTAQGLALPATVGAGFGILLALVLEGRRRERATLQALGEREREVQALNDQLEQRVAARTAELEQKTAALLRAQKLEVLGLVAGGVAHDFNNILTAIMGCAAALREEADQAAAGRRREGLELLDELDESTERARRLTQQLLTLGRSGSARPEPVDLGELVSRLGPLLARLLGESIQVRVPAPLERVVVRADRSQLEQLLLNMAVNARDAMPGGGTLTLSAQRSGAEAFLVVADTGTGMDEATRARLFEPFFTTKPRGRGTGLGMAVVQEVVTRAGGRVDVESRLGRGTRVCVTLPACDEAPAAGGPGAPTSGAHRALRLLVVEDDAAVRRRLVGALAGAGHLVHEAASAEEAERLVRSRRPVLDALVCDVVLPDRSGPDLVQRLRGLGEASPVLYMSGYSPEDLDRSAGPGLVAVLQKPFAPAVLLDRLARLLERQAAG